METTGEKTQFVSEAFILEAHKNACSKWQSKIEDQFPSMFKDQRKEGDWLISKDETLIVRVGTIRGGNLFIASDILVIEDKGYAYHDREVFIFSAFEHVGRLQVESALVKEAKRRGFGQGVTFTATNGEDVCKAQFGLDDHRVFFVRSKVNFDWGYNMALCDNGGCIFSAEKGWAKIGIPMSVHEMIKELERLKGTKVVLK
jgi:hypothetical protein